jgi:hypothetical protein
MSIPNKIFIVPYRNRPEQKFFFCKWMSFLLEHEKNYEIYFSHQMDQQRSFNRGATKNIGFLAMKQKYPNDYKNITFIFNDLDTMPFNRIFDYQTIQGVVKHYYGFEHSLGGIIAIKGEDFEMINGYPNFWSWGMEDNYLQRRCEKNGLKIDRSQFHQIGSPQMLQLFDGISRIINRKDSKRRNNDKTGLSTIYRLKYTIDTISKNETDNIYHGALDNFYYINISHFLTENKFEDDEYFTYDLREPKRNLITPVENKKIQNFQGDPSSWTDIPYYPTTEEQREIIMNKKSIFQTPSNLSTPFTSTKPSTSFTSAKPSTPFPSTILPTNLNSSPALQFLTRPLHTLTSNQEIIPPKIPHIFSPEYAKYMNVTPRASSSANIGLGGIRR